MFYDSFEDSCDSVIVKASMKERQEPKPCFAIFFAVVVVITRAAENFTTV